MPALVNDDRGRPVPLVRCNFTYGPFPHGPLPRDIQREVGKAVQRPGWWMEMPRQRSAIVRSLVFCLLFIGIAQSPFWLSIVRPRLIPQSYTIPAAIVTSAIAFPLMFWFLPHALSDRHRRFLARNVALRGHCGSCGYKLPESTDNHGFYVCPECGSSWDRGPPEPTPPT